MIKEVLLKNRKMHYLCGACVLFFLTLSVVFLSVTVGAQADLTSTVSVAGLSVSSTANSKTDWTGEAGQVNWEGTTSKQSGSGCNSDTYTATNGELTLTNNSGETKVLSFDYSVTLNGGTLSIDGASKTAGGSFSKAMANGASITIKVSSSTTAANKTTVTLSNVKLEVQQVNVTFVASTENGTYKVNGTTITTDTVMTKPSTQTYTLVATPATHYQLEGWYINGVKHESVVETLSGLTFTKDTTVEAKFVIDPLYSIAQLSSGISGALEDYVELDSVYYHNAKGSYHTTAGDMTLNNSYGTHYYFPNSFWTASNGAIVSSASGTAQGDVQTEMGRSNAVAKLYSNVIRVKCLKSCKITFDCSMNASSVNSVDDITAGVYCYIYTTTSASANTSTITTNGTLIAGGDKSSSGSGNAEVTLNAGDYLYIYSYALTLKSENKLTGFPAYATDNYSYSSTISNFVIAKGNESYVVNVGNYDHLGNLLQSGAVVVNGVSMPLTSSNYETEAQLGSQLVMTPGTAPTGYVFIGWQNDSNSPIYNNSENSLTVSANTTVKALYAPIMTIQTSGSNGYESATYSFNGQTYKTGQNPYYVARNADSSAFYTDLNAAFTSSNTIVLIGGHTINGDLVIPSGKTLVLPYGHADDGISGDTPDQTITSATMKNYCLVNYSGNMTVNGALLVNGLQYGSGKQAGRPVGGMGCLVLSDTSTMTVNGSIYAYGLIRGGTITVNNGATVHETMEFGDPRSILIMNAIYEDRKDYMILPMSHFAVESIESSVTYLHGSTLMGHLSLLLSGSSSNSTDAIKLISSSDAWLNLTQGSLTKYYDFENNQTVLRVNKDGVVNVGSITLSISYEYAGQPANVSMVTGEYFMPLDQGLAIEVAGDLTFNYNHKFLPGSRLTILPDGHCTIASGVDIVMYRMNDYDTRGPGTETDYKGYSSYAYPVWSTTYPIGGYTAFKKLADIGSAKLHVDGLLTINGGLYVTDRLISESDQGIADTEANDGTVIKRQEVNAEYFAKNGNYDNGYNILTGSGTIDASNASGSLSIIYEAMVASGSNTPHYDEINVVAVKGMYVGKTEDLPENYSSLAGDIFYGYNNGTYSVWFTNEVALKEKDTSGSDVELFFIRTVGASNALSAGVIMDTNGTIVAAITDPDKGTCYPFVGWSADGTATNAISTTDLLATLFSAYADRAVLYAVIGESHTYSIASCDREYCWNECVCGLTDTKVKRVYTLIFTDYFGKITEKDVNYGDVSILTISTSNIFELSHAGWKINGAGNALASDALWNAFTIDANTTTLNVTEATTPTAIKPGAITMTVNYNNLPAGIAMQVIFFVPVETVDSTAPEVLLNGADTGVDSKHVGEEEGNPIAMYQVTVDLTAAQVAEKATGDSGNAAITITYTDVNLTKQLDSVLLAYAKALQSQLSGSAMGSQANAMEAVMNYGAAVQIYFNAGNEFDFAFTGYTADEIEKYASNIDLSGNAMSNTENDITFTWKSANVNFRTEYNLRYYFTLTGLPEGVTPTTATLTVTYADGKTPAAVYENLAVEADGSRYRVTYPVPASDLAKEGTSVKLVVTLSDGTTVSSSDFSYGINAYLKRSIYQYTEGQKKVANDTDGTKTTQYVNMLVSLIKLGEAVSEIESTTATE